MLWETGEDHDRVHVVGASSSTVPALSRDLFVVQRGQAPQAGVTIVHVSSCDMDEHGDRLSGNRYAALSDDAHGEVQDGRGSPQSMKRPPAGVWCLFHSAKQLIQHQRTMVHECDPDTESIEGTSDVEVDDVVEPTAANLEMPIWAELAFDPRVAA